MNNFQVLKHFLSIFERMQSSITLLFPDVPLSHVWINNTVRNILQAKALATYMTISLG